MTKNLVYLNYWKRKNILKAGIPKFNIIRWWNSEQLPESEQLIFDLVKSSSSVIDIGAGDLSTMKKFKEAGYQGQYHTQDIGDEYKYDYTSLEEIISQYDVILCLDVIEHLWLSDGLTLILKLIDKLNIGGTLVIQTPNGRCIRSPLSSDMTHLHCYNLPDLWTYLTALGLEVDGYRVVFEKPKISWAQTILNLFNRYFIAKVLGMDYADNILLIATKTDRVTSFQSP